MIAQKRETYISDILTNLEKIESAIQKDDQDEEEKVKLSQTIEYISSIRENIKYVLNEETLNNISSSIEKKLKAYTKSCEGHFWGFGKEYTQKEKNSYRNDLCGLISKIAEKLNIVYESIKGAEDDYQNMLLTKNFKYKLHVLAKNFSESKEELLIIRRIYLIFGMILTFSLSLMYIYFFYKQYMGHELVYANHLMLIVVCSPIIFLVIWLFWQVGRYTRLIDIYTFKANLAYTLKTSTDYVLSIEKDSTEKKVTLETLKSLLDKLYESPIKDDVSKSVIIKGIGETTKMLKEIKELVNSK